MLSIPLRLTPLAPSTQELLELRLALARSAALQTPPGGPTQAASHLAMACPAALRRRQGLKPAALRLAQACPAAKQMMQGLRQAAVLQVALQPPLEWLAQQKGAAKQELQTQAAALELEVQQHLLQPLGHARLNLGLPLSAPGQAPRGSSDSRPQAAPS